MEEGEKKKKKQLVHISISTRVTIRERLRLRLVIVAVEGIPAIAGESFTGNAKEKCLSSLFLLSSVPPIPPSDSLPPSPPLLFRARTLIIFKRTSKSGRFLRNSADGLLPFTAKIYFCITNFNGQIMQPHCRPGPLSTDSVQMIFHERQQSSSSVTFFFFFRLLLKCFS